MEHIRVILILAIAGDLERRLREDPRRQHRDADGGRDHARRSQPGSPAVQAAALLIRCGANVGTLAFHVAMATVIAASRPIIRLTLSLRANTTGSSCISPRWAFIQTRHTQYNIRMHSIQMNFGRL